MSDSDITNGELARGIAELKGMVGGLIGRAEYTADQRSAERRFAELLAGIEDARRQHAEDIRELHQRITDQARSGSEHRMRWHDRVMIGVLPAIAALLVGLITLLAAHGGH